MRTITYRDAVREALSEEMERDESVFQIGEDIGRYGGAWQQQRGQLENYGPLRIRQTPISESGFIGLAVGAAMMGLRPVVEIMYGDFLTCAMDQIVNQMAKLSVMSGGTVKVPMVIRAIQGSGSREAAQHSQCLESWFVHTPGIKVVLPSTAYDAKGLLKSAIRDDDPVIFLEHRLLHGDKDAMPKEEYLVPIGRGIVRREGRDITLVTWSRFVQRVMEAAGQLEMEGISAEAIDLRTVAPLDIDIVLASIAKTGRLLVVQEGSPVCGVGAELVRQVVEKGFDYLDAEPLVMGTAHVPMPFAGVLEDACIVQVADIVSRAGMMVRGSG